MEAGNSVSIGGVVLLILGVLAFIASGVFYFVLMARDSISSVNAWYWFIGIAVCAAVWAHLVRLKKVPHR